MVGGTCSCKAGQGCCKHKAAVCHFVNHYVTPSKTNETQSWGKPTTTQLEKYRKGKKMCDMFPPVGFQDMLNSSEVPQNIPAALMKTNCILKKMMVAEQSCNVEGKKLVTQDLTGEVINALYEIQLKNVCYLSKTCNLGYHEEIDDMKWKKLCRDTVHQAQNSEWVKERQNRITSTKAHRIITRRDNHDSLAESLLSVKQFNTTATRYGNEMESVARRKFEVNNESVKQPWFAVVLMEL